MNKFVPLSLIAACVVACSGETGAADSSQPSGAAAPPPAGSAAVGPSGGALPGANTASGAPPSAYTPSAGYSPTPAASAPGYAYAPSEDSASGQTQPVGAVPAQPGAMTPASPGAISEAATTPDAPAVAPATPATPPPVTASPVDPAAPLEGVEETTASINPFVMTEYDPLSTFAVDVDTASYDIFRRDVSRGVLPLPENVRVEEFINFFDYDYAAPELSALVELLKEGTVPDEQGPDEPFAIHLDAAPSLADNGTTLLRIGIKGQQLAPTAAQPANLVFLVDVSGSMGASNKLPLVQHVLVRTLDVLAPTDTVAIVTYAGSTRVALPSTPIADAETIVTAINSLTSSGSTAGAAGLDLAYAEAQAGFVEGAVNNVMLCTDGDFNVGISDPDELVALIEEKRRSGVTFTALGFGTQNNDAMMERVSNAGNGTYSVIYDEGQADEFVEDRMLSALHYIAKDVKIQVEFNSEQVLAYRLLGYENRAIADEDFRNDVVDAGEIGTGHSVTALYELVRAGGALPQGDGMPAVQSGAAYAGEVEIGAGELVRVKVRYKDVDATALDEAYEVYRALKPDEVAESHRDLSPSFQWAVAIASFAEVLRASPYTDASTLPMIEQVVSEFSADDEERTQFAQLFATARTLLEAGGGAR